MMKKIIIIVIAIILAVFTMSCKIIINTNGNDENTADSQSGDTKENNTDDTSDQSSEETGDETEQVYPHSDMELAPLDDIVATTEHMSFPVSTLKYFVMSEYSSFLYQYYYYLSYYNFDESIPLHDQQYTFSDENITWYQVFLDEGKAEFEQYATFAEMATKEGIKLGDDDYAKIEANLASIDKMAEEYSQTFEEYMAQYMGENMTRDRMKAALEVVQLGYKYYNKIYNEPVYTEEQIEDEYKNGGGKYSLVDYNEATIYAVYDETDTDEQVEAAKNAVKEKAEKMKELIESGTNFADAYKTAAADEDNGTTSFLFEGKAYYSAERYEFLYADGTKEGQVNITYDDSGNASVIQCVKLPYKDTTKSVSFRHIILSPADYDSEEEAYAMGQELLQQINEAADKKAEFISLVPTYSSDTNSSTIGGLYEDITPGQLDEELDKWCFEEGRNVGDTGLVLTDYGYHVMYLEGYGDEVWHCNCETALRDEDFSKISEEIYETVKIEYNEDLLDRLTK